LVALAWANSSWQSAYDDLRDHEIGPAALDLHLSVADWAGDGLLAIFFFVAGLELKREFTVGSLRRPAEALLPIGSALLGMAVPALIYLVVTRGEPGAARGWAIPTATDLAFCLAVLAVVGSAIPLALRAFLLTLAVVDDLVAIVIIGAFYSSDVDLLLLVAAVLPLLAYAGLQRAGVDSWPLLLPLAVLAWGLTHAAGVHPTVAAVAVGLLTRVHPKPRHERGPVERFEQWWRPVSAGLAVPLFALFSVGIAISGDSLTAAFHDPATIGVVVGRLVGKTVGIFGGAYLLVRLTGARLNPDLAWADVFGVAVLAGIGFAVPLLVSDVAFGPGSAQDDRVTAGILAAALIAAIAGGAWLRGRHRRYARLAAEEDRDDDQDGIPDVYQRPDEGHTGRDHG
ncbi:MAG: Na+:H+ antiporter, NhaA family, partial [Actinomycetota bacterium]|nr:Na+:H+ antiporter, NhaA family [Actinomycetota bacterium]